MGVVAYDGTDFRGWQSQRGGHTIQDFLEARLAVVFKTPVRVHGSGRTDSGVHARAQVFHFDAAWDHPVSHLERALRVGLPAGILVRSVRPAPADFHARQSAVGKRYCYRLYEGLALPFDSRFVTSLGRRRLEDGPMREAAQLLLGRHDFSAFCADRRDGSREDPVKDLRRLEVTRRGNHLRITTEASGYLYKMVRSLAGALIDVGLGKLTPADIDRILRNRQRTTEVVTAPARGLTLERVFYGSALPKAKAIPTVKE